jgi:hypothetical protein
MKKTIKLSLLTLLTAILCLGSCSKTNNSAPQTAILGKWRLNSIRTVYYRNNIKEEDTTRAADNSLFVLFTADGHFADSTRHSMLGSTHPGSPYYIISGDSVVLIDNDNINKPVSYITIETLTDARLSLRDSINVSYLNISGIFTYNFIR